jgi:integrase
VPESRRRRRPRGRGTVYALGPSTWRVRLRWTDPDSGAPREAERQVRGTRARAEEALDRLRADLAAGRLDGPSVAGERLTLNGWLDAWLDQRRLRVRAITQEHAERALRNYVRPTLGAVRLARLRPAHLQRLYGDLQAHRGLSPVTIRWVHAILRASLRAAVRLKLLPESPTEGVELPPLGDGERRPPRRRRCAGCWRPARPPPTPTTPCGSSPAAPACASGRRAPSPGATWTSPRRGGAP